MEEIGKMDQTIWLENNKFQVTQAILKDLLVRTSSQSLMVTQLLRLMEKNIQLVTKLSQDKGSCHKTHANISPRISGDLVSYIFYCGYSKFVTKNKPTFN